MAGTAPDIPDRFAKHLIRSERIVVAVRRHPAQVLEPVLSAVAALLVVLWLQSLLSPDISVVPDLLWLLWLGVLLRALWRLYEWSQDWFVVTNLRMMLSYGVLTRRVAMMPITKVTDMSYNRSIPGRLMGFGEFVLESAGQDQALDVVSWLPNPDSIYRLVCTQMYPEEKTRGQAARVPPPLREPHGWRGFRLGPEGEQPRARAQRYETDILQVGDPVAEAAAVPWDDDDWDGGDWDGSDWDGSDWVGSDWDGAPHDSAEARDASLDHISAEEYDSADDGDLHDDADDAAWDVLGRDRGYETEDAGPAASAAGSWRSRLDPRNRSWRGWDPRGWDPRKRR